jgi:hypothetical protein
MENSGGFGWFGKKREEKLSAGSACGIAGSWPARFAGMAVQKRNGLKPGF